MTAVKPDNDPLEANLIEFIDPIIPLAKAGPMMLLGHTRLYEEVKAGRLTIVKNGKSSGIRASEVRRYNASLPEAVLARDVR